MSELLPCPFCGGVAVVGIVDGDMADATCVYCHVHLYQFNGVQGATHGWNRRYPVYPDPDWSHAPEWAQWWAVDSSCMAYWYQTQPTMVPGMWYCPKGHGHWSCMVGDEPIDLPLGCDWRLTLRRRPEVGG